MKLYFDSQCPICVSFVKLLRKNLSEQIEFLEMPQSEGEQASDFKLETLSGEVLSGKEAIDFLAKEVPKIKDFFWMLPDSYRGKVLYETYAFGKFLRRLVYFFSGKHCGGCR